MLKNVPIFSHNQLLDASLITPDSIKSQGNAILFIHGWKSSQDGYISRAQVLAKLGYVCLTFSLRGQGKSEGNIQTLTSKDFLDDVLAAYDFLAEQENVEKEKIHVVGASFGGYLAALLLQMRHVHSIVLRVPADYPDENFAAIPHIKSTHENITAIEWRKHITKDTDTMALRALHNFPRDILIIASGKDTIIPHQIIVNYMHAIQNPEKLTYTVMRNAEHALLTEKEKQEFIAILVKWFGKEAQK